MLILAKDNLRILDYKKIIFMSNELIKINGNDGIYIIKGDKLVILLLDPYELIISGLIRNVELE